jgi:hypothetical protein
VSDDGSILGRFVVREATGLISILEGTIREIVRQEVSSALQAHQATPLPAGRERWLTPPAAARQVGISEKAIRNMIRTGAIVPRLRNVDPNPRQPKYLVNVDDVTLVAQRPAPLPDPAASTEGQLDLEDHARRIRARAGGR